MSLAANRTQLWTFVAIAVLWLGQMLAFHAYSVSHGRGGLSPVELGGDDGRHYYELARMWAFTAAPDPDAYANVYPCLLASLMWLTGSDSVLLFKFLNYVVVLCSLWWAVRLAATVYGPEKSLDSRLLMLALGFFPSLSLFGFSFSLGRDGWVYALYVGCTSLAAWAYVNRERVAPPQVLAFVLAVGGLFAFRWYMAIVFLAACVTTAALDFIALRPEARDGSGSSSRTLGFSPWFLALCVLGAVCMLGRFSGQRQVSSLQAVLSFRGLYRTAEGASKTIANSTSAPTPDEVLRPKLPNRPPELQPDGNLGICYSERSPAVWPLLWGYSIASNAFGPLPWQVKNVRMALAAPEGLFILLTCLYIAMHWRQVDRPLAMVLVQAWSWLLAIGFFNDNLGTGMRLRVPSVILLLVCAAVVRAKVRCTRQTEGESALRRPIAAPHRAGALAASLPQS